MAEDIHPGYQDPFEMPSEEAVAFKDGAIEGKPAGVPASYTQGYGDGYIDGFRALWGLD